MCFVYMQRCVALSVVGQVDRLVCLLGQRLTIRTGEVIICSGDMSVCVCVSVLCLCDYLPLTPNLVPPQPLTLSHSVQVSSHDSSPVFDW